jgi:choline-sulfatase
VRLPGGARAGETVARPVSLLDVAPTLLELAGAGEGQALDGRSLLGDEDGVVLSEYHVEKVRAPCFMARKGRHKLIHVHGHDARLYDLVADPGEWHDLAGSPELREVEDGLRAAILARFDPERIAADGAASVARRELIARAMQRNGTQWDYQPEFDARRRYVR